VRSFYTPFFKPQELRLSVAKPDMWLLKLTDKKDLDVNDYQAKMENSSDLYAVSHLTRNMYLQNSQFQARLYLQEFESLILQSAVILLTTSPTAKNMSSVLLFKLQAIVFYFVPCSWYIFLAFWFTDPSSF